MVVLVFCYGGSGVRRWWVGCGWGVDGCWQRGWAVVGVVGFFILYFYILLVFLMLF